MAPSKPIRNLKAVGQRLDRLDQAALVRWIMGNSEPARGAQFYEATSGLLFGLLLHALRDPATAEDVLSRVYADISQQAAQFDKQSNSLLVWLITIAHWRAYEDLRFKGKKPERMALIAPRQRRPKAVPDLGISKFEHQRLVAATLSPLSPMQLQMIELAYFCHLAPLEIALRLGQRLEVVKVGLQDGMAKLCDLFKTDFPNSVIKRRLSRIA